MRGLADIHWSSLFDRPLTNAKIMELYLFTFNVFQCEADALKVGILGTGNVGQMLGTGFVKLGHNVKMGSRDPNSDKVKAWVVKNGVQASAGTFTEAAFFAEIVVKAFGGGTSAAMVAQIICRQGIQHRGECAHVPS
jgi:hypothetical protein